MQQQAHLYHFSLEWIDILDDRGSPTGRTKPKPDVHRDGDWHRAVHIWILTPDGRILIQRRALAKENHPGLWDVSCAGHVSTREAAADAAIRETHEELGLDLGPGELRPLATLRESSVLNGGSYIDNEIHEIFVVRRDVDVNALRLQVEEVDEVRLVTIEEFRSLDRVPHGQEYALIEGVI